MISCPAAYDRFLDTIFTKEDRDSLERWIGLTKIKFLSAQQFLVLSGPPKTGKTAVIYTVIMHTFGDEWMGVPEFAAVNGRNLVWLQGDAEKYIKKYKDDPYYCNVKFIIETNQPVNIEEDDKICILRPTGNIIPPDKYTMYLFALDELSHEYAKYCIDKLFVA